MDSSVCSVCRGTLQGIVKNESREDYEAGKMWFTKRSTYFFQGVIARILCNFWEIPDLDFPVLGVFIFVVQVLFGLQWKFCATPWGQGGEQNNNPEWREKSFGKILVSCRVEILLHLRRRVGSCGKGHTWLSSCFTPQDKGWLRDSSNPRLKVSYSNFEVVLICYSNAVEHKRCLGFSECPVLPEKPKPEQFYAFWWFLEAVNRKGLLSPKDTLFSTLPGKEGTSVL